MWVVRRRVLASAVATLGLALVSGAPYSRASSHTALSLAQSPEADLARAETHVVSTFELHAANTLEVVEVRYVDGVLDPQSKQQIDHLMRCLRTDSAKSIDPRLVDIMRDIAREVDKPLWLVSGYRAPLNRREHNFHNRGMAADIRVEGMPAYKLRNVARKLGVLGVGYYPTTNMIHVDVRDEAYFWTDSSGPHQNGLEIRTR